MAFQECAGGVRKAKKQLSRLTRQDKTKISDEKAQKFRSDVGTAKMIKGLGDRKAWVRSNTKQLGGQKYAEAVLKQANKEKARNFIFVKAPIGAAIAMPFLVLNDLGKGLSVTL